MRPPAIQQDPLRTPLNEILGSEGAVRVLRVLSDSQGPMARATVAQRAALNPSGVRRILDRLAQMGLVEVMGSGRNQAVRLRSRHPLAEPVRSLFHAEHSIFDQIVRAARLALSEEEIGGAAIWIESSSARSPGTVDVGVLADPADLERIVSAVQVALEALEGELAMHFVVHGYTDADRSAGGDQRWRLEDVTLLHGWIPALWRGERNGPIATHRVLDENARLLAEAIAEVLPNDPSLIDRATKWINERLQAASPRGAHELREWQRILSQLSLRQIQSLLTEDSERADRLRQSLPFLDVLSSSERTELLKVSGA